MNGFAADVLLAAHFALAAFILAGLPLVWIGAWRGWAWIRNRAFRFIHLGAIVFVALEALVGYACPLTRWEDALRGAEGGRSFVGRWFAWLLYYHAPEWMFTLLYLLWTVCAVVTLLLAPPRQRIQTDISTR